MNVHEVFSIDFPFLECYCIIFRFIDCCNVRIDINANNKKKFLIETLFNTKHRHTEPKSLNKAYVNKCVNLTHCVIRKGLFSYIYSCSIILRIVIQAGTNNYISYQGQDL